MGEVDGSGLHRPDGSVQRPDAGTLGGGVTCIDHRHPSLDGGHGRMVPDIAGDDDVGADGDGRLEEIATRSRYGGHPPQRPLGVSRHP